MSAVSAVKNSVGCANCSPLTLWCQIIFARVWPKTFSLTLAIVECPYKNINRGGFIDRLWEGWGWAKARSVNFSKKKTVSGHKPELDVNFCVYWSFLVGRGVELCTTTQIHYMGERDPNQNLRLNASQTTWTLVTFLPPPTPRRWGSYSLLCHLAFLFQTLWYVLEQPQHVMSFKTVLCVWTTEQRRSRKSNK